MHKLNDTTGLCEHCYRHIPAMTFERDNSVYIGKSCPVHGYVEHLVEPNAEFYKNHKYTKTFRDITTYLLDITNRCNLNCPHCYQIPDNTSTDPSIEYILELVRSYPDDGYGICLAGAEPSTRKDLHILIKQLRQLPGKRRPIIVLTNAVNLSNIEYCELFIDIPDLLWGIGLNHPDYQGATVRRKQIQGIENCIKLGLPIKNISYTLENLSQLEYCLDEIIEFSGKYTNIFRIRTGIDIGRNPHDPLVYLSQLVSEVEQLCIHKGYSCVHDQQSGIRAHYPLIINDIYIKIIQWPDVRTLDLEEIQTESWSDILPGKPISPLVHQAILRDYVVNNNNMLLDTVPKQYRRINN